MPTRTRHRTLGETLLAEMEKHLAAFDVASAEFDKGRREHTGARGDLSAVADQCTELARLFDGLVLARFRKDEEQMAAWRSARNMDGPPRGVTRSVAEPSAEAPATTPEQPNDPPSQSQAA